MDDSPAEDPALVRFGRWLQASPAELLGLVILVLGAIVASLLLWQQATSRPTTLVNDSAAVGQEYGPSVPDDAPGADSWHDASSGQDQSGGHDVDGGLHEPDAPVDAEAPRSSAEVVVHVTGAVNDPGVVVLRDGGRVSDAVDAAGGMNAQAVPELINLARPLSDGEHVHIPIEGEDPPPIPAVAPSGAGAPAGPRVEGDGRGTRTPIDVNRATAAELETLPGIGPARAQAIIEYRDANGPFATPGDLRAVSGIGEATFQNLAEHVTVG